VAAFSGCEGSFAKSLLEGNDGTGFESAEFLLHLCPALLDGVEVGRVGRQVTERSPGLLNEFSDAIPLVRSQVIHDDQFGRVSVVGKETLSDKPGRRLDRRETKWT
jgi:hypothetical protein